MNHWIRLSLLGGLLLWRSWVQAEHYALPLFLAPTSTSSDAATGVVRILNASDESGPVAIYAIDDAGTRSGPATFTLIAFAAAEFSASELVSGNTAEGLTGGVGSLSGHVRLEIETDLSIVPAAYVRTADGMFSTMHDTVRAGTASGGGHEYLVPIFNPATEMTQASSLRLINPGEAGATVTIEGRDDFGNAATGGAVQLTLAAGAAQTLSAQQLEAGDASLVNLTGQLGAGVGKWRLSVSYDDGDECEASLYFASRTGGWFASSCTGTDNPDGYWVAGTWSIVDDGDDTPETGSPGDCRVGMLLRMGQSCTYPGTTDAFSVNARGRGRFLDRLFGIRIRIDNETINGRVYDFAASHQGDGVWRIDRIAGSTEPPGESVYIKAGASEVEPLPVLEGTYLRMNIDIGNQSRGGEQAAVLGNVANSRPCEQAPEWERKSFPAQSVPAPVTASSDGRVWILFGSDSGFEGRTQIYYTRVSVTLTPV